MRNIEKELEAILPYLLKITKEEGKHTYLSGDVFQIGYENALMKDNLYKVFTDIVSSQLMNEMDVVDVWCLMVGYAYGQQELSKLKNQISKKYNKQKET